MGNVPIEKITTMLDVYREKLERVSIPPIDYVEGIRLSAQISILEHLFILAHHDAAQQLRALDGSAYFTDAQIDEMDEIAESLGGE